MPQQSWNKILDLRVTGTWIRKKRVEVGSCLQWSQVQINYCDKTIEIYLGKKTELPPEPHSR